MMKRKLCLNLALALGLGLGAVAVWAQDTQIPDLPMPPPPPPDGQFFYVRSEGMFGGLEPIKGAPFSARAVTETTQVLADGNQINRTETSQLYRDSAGRTRRETTLTLVGPWAAAKTPRQIVNISDPVAGFNYMLDVNDKTAVKLPVHADSGRMRMKEEHITMMAGAGGAVAIQKSDGGPDGPGLAVAGSVAEPDSQSKIQRTSESLGTRQMAGVTAQGTRTTETIPAGLIGNQDPIVTISERWYSPELHTTVYSKRTDPRFGTTVYELTGITRTEPDVSLFQVPPDYTVKDKPGMMLRPKPAE
jgi:hypothetical protein